MYALEALADDGADSEQTRSFRGPVARRAIAVFGAGKDHQRHFFSLILHGSVVDRHLLAVGPMLGETAFRDIAVRASQHEVLDADVGESAAHHHLMVAAPRAVLIEIGGTHLMLGQIFSGRRGEFDRARR